MRFVVVRRLQLAVRDKVIQRQQKILTDHNLDDKVGYPQMALLEQTLMSDVDLSSSLVPPSPPRSLSELTGREILPVQYRKETRSIDSV